MGGITQQLVKLHALLHHYVGRTLFDLLQQTKNEKWTMQLSPFAIGVTLHHLWI